MRLLAALTLAAALVLTSTPAQAMRGCPTEDSRNCVWDAQHAGNGHGRSFWVGTGGKVHYVSHAKAHCMRFTPGRCRHVR